MEMMEGFAGGLCICDSAVRSSPITGISVVDVEEECMISLTLDTNVFTFFILSVFRCGLLFPPSDFPNSTYTAGVLVWFS